MKLQEAWEVVEKIAPYSIETGGGSTGLEPSAAFNLTLDLTTSSNGDRYASVLVSENIYVRPLPWGDMLAEIGELFPSVTVTVTTGYGGRAGILLS